MMRVERRPIETVTYWDLVAQRYCPWWVAATADAFALATHYTRSDRPFLDSVIGTASRIEAMLLVSLPWPDTQPRPMLMAATIFFSLPLSLFISSLRRCLGRSVSNFIPQGAWLEKSESEPEIRPGGLVPGDLGREEMLVALLWVFSRGWCRTRQVGPICRWSKAACVSPVKPISGTRASASKSTAWFRGTMDERLTSRYQVSATPRSWAEKSQNWVEPERKLAQDENRWSFFFLILFSIFLYISNFLISYLNLFWNQGTSWMPQTKNQHGCITIYFVIYIYLLSYICICFLFNKNMHIIHTCLF
jgi:hypothetical protein